jgi:hypothetical protein
VAVVSRNYYTRLTDTDADGSTTNPTNYGDHTYTYRACWL